jgi:hypothetical protein
MVQLFGKATVRKIQHQAAIGAQLIKRREAAELLGVTVRTLDRRERDDPRIPARVAMGPAGGAPFAFVRAEWLAYVAGLPRVAAQGAAEREGAAPKGFVTAEVRRTPKTTPKASAARVAAIPAGIRAARGKPIQSKSAGSAKHEQATRHAKRARK